jgi:hypothetical protein
MRMRMADGFEHFQLAGFNDGDGLRAGDGRETFQEIFNGFAAFEGVNQILQGDTGADKHGRAAHDFGIGVNDAFQIFDCHNMVKIPLPAELSPANMTVGRAPAVLRRERRWVRSAFGGEFNAALVAPFNSQEGRNLAAGMERQPGRSGAV